MELSAGRHHVSQQDRDARIREGLCFHSGGVGHRSSVCPAKCGPAGLPSGRPAARISGLDVNTDLIDLSSPPPVAPCPRNLAGHV